MGQGTRGNLPAEEGLGSSPYGSYLLSTNDGEELVLRPMEHEDSGALAEFYHTLDDYTDRMFFILSDFTEAVTRDVAVLQENRRELHLLLHEPNENSVVGHVSLQPFPGMCPRLGICVKQGWQGRGLGRQMMELVVTLTQDLPDSTGIWLSVLAENAGARALYDSMGFEPVRERTVRRRFSRFRGNRGTYVLVDMILSFPLIR